MENKPKKGLKGLIENWQSDLVAALSVAPVSYTHLTLPTILLV